MNWVMLSTLAEVSSSVAILITLIYLAIQTRQNSTATQAQTRQAIVAGDQAFLTWLASNPDIETLRFKRELTDEEKVRLGFTAIAFMRMRENNWLQFRNGVLDEVTWRTYRNSITAFMGSPHMRLWWHRYSTARAMFDPEFVALVDDLLERIPVVERSMLIGSFD